MAAWALEYTAVMIAAVIFFVSFVVSGCATVREGVEIIRKNKKANPLDLGILTFTTLTMAFAAVGAFAISTAIIP